MQKIKCGVIGVGHLGRHHTRIYKNLPQCELVGIYDIDPHRCKAVSEELGVEAFGSSEDLINQVDAISLAVPTSHHYENAKKVLLSRKHLLIEKPITESVEQAKELVSIAKSSKVILSVGHTERFSPAFRAAKEWIEKPKYIESLRLSGFGTRGIDVSVIHDLMIHDIDLVLNIIQSPLKSIDAIGVPVFTTSVDIANARLEFQDGSIASLTASRVSKEKVRKIRFFQSDRYISVDLLRSDVKIYRKKGEFQQINCRGGAAIEDLIEEINPHVELIEPLQLEIEDFALSVLGQKRPEITGEQGLRALEVGANIIESLEKRRMLWK
ncbi:MAG: Gfo/Idh/MocA family protein [bacterium]